MKYLIDAIDDDATFQRLVEFNLPKLSQRAKCLSVEQWRMEMRSEATDLPYEITPPERLEVANRVGSIHSKLIYYELKDAFTSLELSVWKSKINEMGAYDTEGRGSCRVTCGADIIMPKVRSYHVDEKVLKRALDAMELR